MKALVIGSSIVIALAAAGKVRHCGHLTSVVLAKQMSLVRMGLYNGKSQQPYLSVTDETAITETIRVIRNMESYSHTSAKDDFDWSSQDGLHQYFVCIEGQSFRKVGARNFLDSATDLRVWKNKKLVFRRLSKPAATGLTISRNVEASGETSDL